MAILGRRAGGWMAGCILLASAAAYAQYDLTWNTIDGGATSTGGNHELSGTIGQSDARSQPMTGGGFSLTGGFWVIPTCTAHPADFDGDCDVDQGDYLIFESCATGPGFGPVETSCVGADFDHDNDVDQTDFGVFQRCFSGIGLAADPHCSD